MGNIRATTKRRYRRRTLRVRVEYEGDAGKRSDTATTLGAGGLFIETDEPLQPGSTLTLRFRLCDGGALHEIAGRVVWANGPDAPSAASPGMGIEFTDRSGRTRLARELETLDRDDDS